VIGIDCFVRRHRQNYYNLGGSYSILHFSYLTGRCPKMTWSWLYDVRDVDFINSEPRPFTLRLVPSYWDYDIGIIRQITSHSAPRFNHRLGAFG
jgi:hypothetical protein